MSSTRRELACGELRAKLSSTRDLMELDLRTVDHLEQCRPCSTWLARLREARRQLGRPQAWTVPDPEFALRVRARLPDSALEPIGETARRWIPLAAAVLLLLGWANWSVSGASEMAVDPLDDLLSWSLEGPDVQSPGTPDAGEGE